MRKDYSPTLRRRASPLLLGPLGSFKEKKEKTDQSGNIKVEVATEL